MVPSKVLYPILGGLLAASCCAASLLAQNPATLRARVILGLEGVADNFVGDLSVRENGTVFQDAKGLPCVRYLHVLCG
jgi:hypothetical protein